MKRAVILAILLISLLVLPLAIAVENDSEENGEVTVDDEDTSEDQVDKAYECLESKITDKGCGDLPTPEKIFALMATGKCSSEVRADSSQNQCWPKSNCDIKTTAQAILALDNAGSSTTTAEDWLVSQTKEPDNVDWFLQIESNDAVTCSIKYSTTSNSITIGKDKEINQGAGSCLAKSAEGYWLKISPSCYDHEFEISCDKSFLTSLLFKKSGSPTYHVLDEVQSSSSEGTTVEKVNSFCFAKGTGPCDYEGSLWAAIALKNEDRDISAYLPYLISTSDAHENLLPEAFLYILTGYDDLRSTLLQKQKENQYWKEKDSKFYDTAVALYPFQYQTPPEKTNTMGWLLEIQGRDGCWDGGNILTNSFLLYSVWPEDVEEDQGDIDCVDAGYHCMSSVDCTGEILTDYDCSGVSRCCDTPREVGTCQEQQGQICTSNKICSGGITVEASDTEAGEICCTGSCADPEPESACESAGGVCRSYGCDSSEIETTDQCNYDYPCCMPKASGGGGAWLWIIIFLILITLVVLGIIYRDKLRMYWMRFTSKGGRPPAGGAGPRGMGGPPLFPTAGAPMARPRPRRIMPPRRAPARRPGPKPKSPKEIDNVLKKLKEIGK